MEKPPGGWPRRTGWGRVSVGRAADSGGRGRAGSPGGARGGGQVGSASASGASGSGRRLEWAFAYCRGPIHVWSRFVVFSHPLPSKGMSL